jgi:signal transduction histidine kinase
MGAGREEEVIRLDREEAARLLRAALLSEDAARTKQILCEVAFEHPGARLFRIAEHGALLSFRPDGDAQEPPQASQILASLRQGRVPPSLVGKGGAIVLPIESGAGETWGFWVVPEVRAVPSRAILLTLEDIVRHLLHLEKVESLRQIHQDLSIVLNLGHSLNRAETPEEMAEAIDLVLRQVLHAETTGLLFLSSSEPRLLSCTRERGVVSRSLGATAFRPEEFFISPRWEAKEPAGVLAGRLLETSPLRGMAERVGDPARPIALLLLFGGNRPFTARDASLLARVADFVYLSLLRWEQVESHRKKARQVADLFTLLARQKDRLDAVLEAVPVGIMLLDRNGQIELCNEEASRALGLTQVERSEKKLFSTRDAGRTLLGLLEKTAAEGHPVNSPLDIQGRWHQVEVRPPREEGRYLVVTQDIHSWYMMAKAQENLISVISHEIKNPLTAVINAADLLQTARAGPLTESQSRMVSLILENGRSIRALLDDVSRLSRIQLSSRSALTRVDLAPLARKAVEERRALIEAKDISVRMAVEECAVLGQVSMLESLFANLVGNAVKYAVIKGHVGIELRPRDGGVTLKVMDDGPGIPPSDIEKIGTPFFRASNVRDKIEGTGLGLVIVKNVAEHLGSKLRVHSPLAPEERAFWKDAAVSGPGTVFEVIFPPPEQGGSHEEKNTGR